MDNAITDCLARLHAADSSAELARIEHLNGSPIKEYYSWILETKEFQEWRHDDSGQLLWLRGEPGRGKTMFMAGLVRDYANIMDEDPSNITYFFCRSSDPELSEPASIVRGLIWKLVMNRPELGEVLCSGYEANKPQLFGRNILQGYFSILRKLLAVGPPSTILIDGIDECTSGHERNELFDLICTHATSSNSKWLVSGCFLTEIGDLSMNMVKSLSLEYHPYQLTLSVSSFIDHKVKDILAINSLSQSHRGDLEKRLKHRANDSFLWVSIACNFISTASQAKAPTLYKTLRSGLHRLYEYALGFIKTSAGEDYQHLCLRILQSACVAFRPLSIEELVAMIGLRLDFRLEERINQLIKACKCFIFAHEGRVYFTHQSAKEWLMGHVNRDIFSPSQQHDMATHQTVTILLEHLKQDICELGSPGAHVALAVPNVKLKSIAYACCFWVDHLLSLIDSPASAPQKYRSFVVPGGLVHELLFNRLLHWFEALSLLGQLERGLKQLQRWKQIAEGQDGTSQESPHYHVLPIISDSARLLRRFGGSCHQAPLQVYSSLLIFAPESSLVRQAYQRDLPSWISSLPKLSREWDAVLQVISTDHPTSAIYSPDGEQVVVASGDKATFYDAKTGSPLQTLHPSPSVIQSIAFSSDGKKFATGWSRNWREPAQPILKIWDGSDTIVRTLATSENISAEVIAFSPDGLTLASIEKWGDSTVLWDLVDEHHRAPWINYDEETEDDDDDMGPNELSQTGASIEFSPDGRTIASCHGNDKITLRNVNTGTPKWLDCVGGSITSIAFSSDGRHIVSSSEEKKLDITDLETFATRTLSGHTNVIECVAYSPDDKWLVSASRDDTVRLWNAETGVDQVFDRDPYPTSSVAISPDGQEASVLLYSGQVQILDMTGPFHGRSHNNNESRELFRNIALFPDNKRLAALTRDGSLTIRNAVTSEVLKDFGTYKDPFSHIAISPNGQALAFSLVRKTRIWNSITGDLERSLESVDVISFVTFSPDSQQLVTIERKYLNLWDLSTGTHVHSFDCSDFWATNVFFSRDGQKLGVSGGNIDFTLWRATGPWDIAKLWDTTTGELLLENRNYNRPGESISQRRYQYSPVDGSAQASSPEWIRSRAQYQVQVGSRYDYEPLSGWITWNGRNLIWLPDEYRAHQIAIGANLMVIMTHFGWLYTIHFHPDAAFT